MDADARILARLPAAGRHAPGMTSDKAVACPSFNRFNDCDREGTSKDCIWSHSMNERSSTWVRRKVLFALLPLVSGLGGCATAIHALVSPGLNAAIGAAAEANATPETMGITTTEFRGLSCDELVQKVDMFKKEQSSPANDEFTRKTYGWRVAAAQTVQYEQGCTPAGTSAGKSMPKEMKMYFFCWGSGDARTNRSLVTTAVFERTVSLTDPMHRYNLTSAFAEEFKQKVLTVHRVPDANPLCQFEDNATTMGSIRARLRSNLSDISTRTVDVNWQPTANVPPTPPKAAGAATGAKLEPGLLAPALGARFEPLNDKVSKAAGLASTGGAVVVSVTAGGPAARAGLKPKDIVVTISGQAITKPEDVEAVVSTLGGGAKAPVQLRRGGKKMELSVKLPGPVAAKTPAASPAVPATPVVAVTTPALVPKASGPKACAAWLILGNGNPPKDRVLTRFESTVADAAGMQAAFEGFLGHMRSKEGKWDADLSKKAYCSELICVSYTTHAFAPNQQAALTCQGSSEELEKRFPHVKEGGSGFRTVEWSPA